MKYKIKYSIIAIVAFAFLTQSCVKEQFDDVPDKEYITDINELYDIDSITSIASLKEMYGNNPSAISGEVFLKATVISDDEKGNFYKELVFQDSTGGLEIQIDSYDLYKKYPPGQLVYIKCEGLFYSIYRGTPQLGFLSNGESVRLPEKVLEDFIFKAEGGEEIQAKTIKISELNDSHINTLIKIDNVQFSDTSKTYAEEQTTVNRSLGDIYGNTIDLRTSGYAEFWNEKVPEGNGSITAVFGVYDADKQLAIRTTDDVNMPENRFNQTSETFNSGLGTFSEYSVSGSASWEGDSHAGENFVAISGYQEGLNEDWLISPEIDLTDSEQAIFFFSHATGYLTDTMWEEDLTIWTSSDYDGTGDPNDFTWTELTDFNRTSTDDWWTWVESGTISLSDYIGGKVYVAFKYTNPSNYDAVKWEIDNFSVIVL